MYLFPTISYRLSGQQIEYINDPEVATTILGMLTYTNDLSKSHGLNQLWYKDSSTDAYVDYTGFAAHHDFIITKPANKGSFSLAFPLMHIFGFAEIVYGFKHELSLVRDSDANAVLRAAVVNDVSKTILRKIPHVNPSDQENNAIAQDHPE